MGILQSLPFRYARGRRRRLILLSGLVAAIVLIVVVLLGFVSSARVAVRQSVSLEFAPSQAVISVRDPEVNHALGTMSGLSPIWDLGDTLLSTPDSVAPVIVRFTEGGHGFRRVTLGDEVMSTGEATLPESVARSLGVVIGDSVTLGVGQGSTDYRVVGLTINELDRWDRLVVAFRPEHVTNLSASRWAASFDPHSSEALRPLIGNRNVDVATPSMVLETELDLLSENVQAIELGAITVGCCGVLVVLLVMRVSRKLNRQDAAALAAAGVGRRQSLCTIGLPAGGAVLAGGALGGALGHLLVVVLSDVLSRSINQQWAHATFPAVLTVLYVGALILGLLVLLAIDLFTSGHSGAGGVELHRGVWLLIGGAAVMLIALCVQFVLVLLEVVTAPKLPVILGFPVAFILAAGAAPVAARILVCRRGSVVSKAAAYLSRPLQGIAAVVGVIIVAATYFSGTQANHTYQNVDFYASIQPVGSLAVNEISPDSADTIIERYRALGGRQYDRLEIPNEEHHSVRITAPRVVQCLDKLNTKDTRQAEHCFVEGGDVSPLGPVYLDAVDVERPLAVTQSAQSQGEAGILVFRNSDSYHSTAIASQVETEPSTVGSHLGGRLPTGVVGLQSAFARDYQLSASGAQLLVLMDFGDMSDVSQAQLRSAVYGLAPASQVSEHLAPEDKMVRRLGVTVSLLAALTILAIMVPAGCSISESQGAHRSELRALADGDQRHRHTVDLINLPLMIGVVIASMSGAWLMWYANPHNNMGFGWEWLVPPTAAIGGAFFLAGFARSARGKVNQTRRL